MRRGHSAGSPCASASSSSQRNLLAAHADVNHGRHVSDPMAGISERTAQSYFSHGYVAVSSGQHSPNSALDFFQD